MKIIHCADLHLDSKLNAFLDSNIATMRNRELVNNFKRLADQAEAWGVKVIMICGDMFDRSTITRGTKKRIYEIISAHPEVDFLYLTGNHDKNDFLDGAEVLNNLKTFSKDGWTTYKYGNVSIYGADIMENNVKELAHELALDRRDINIVMMHGQEEDSARDAKGGTIIPIRLFADLGIDYMALGHIHSFSEKKLDDRGVYVYSGCLEGRGYDEPGEKGFVLIDTDTSGGLNYSFVPFANRHIHVVELEVADEDTTEELINKSRALLSSVSPEDMVKLYVKGKVSENYIVDAAEFEEAFSDKFLDFRFEERTSLKIDTQKLALDKSMKGEFLRILSDSNLDEEQKRRVAKLGIDAFFGE